MNSTDVYLSKLPIWQQENLAIFRAAIHTAVSNVTEELKWNVPVFIVNGRMLFAMSAFKEHTKFNFIANGALLSDPDTLFNNGLESKKSRGIDLRKGEIIDQESLLALIKSAIDAQ